jgi:hypothetical protein
VTLAVDRTDLPLANPPPQKGTAATSVVSGQAVMSLLAANPPKAAIPLSASLGFVMDSIDAEHPDFREALLSALVIAKLASCTTAHPHRLTKSS